MGEFTKKIITDLIKQGKVLKENNKYILSIDLDKTEEFKKKFSVDPLEILDLMTPEEQNDLLSTYYK